MWDNIGSRLQTAAKVICWIGIIASVISGIVAISAGGNGATIITALLSMVGGALASWVGSWAMYGLGLVVEKVEETGSLTGRAYAGSPRYASGMADGWECPKCHTKNPFSKVECKECGTVRQ